jgi:tRNA-dihydrouridine synthase
MSLPVAPLAILWQLDATLSLICTTTGVSAFTIHARDPLRAWLEAIAAMDATTSNAHLAFIDVLASGAINSPITKESLRALAAFERSYSVDTGLHFPYTIEDVAHV